MTSNAPEIVHHGSWSILSIRELSVQQRGFDLEEQYLPCIGKAIEAIEPIGSIIPPCTEKAIEAIEAIDDNIAPVLRKLLKGYDSVFLPSHIPHSVLLDDGSNRPKHTLWGMWELKHILNFSAIAMTSIGSITFIGQGNFCSCHSCAFQQ